VLQQVAASLYVADLFGAGVELSGVSASIPLKNYRLKPVDSFATESRVVLVDGRNLFPPEAALAAGFDYTGIGRSIRSRTTVSQTTSGPQEA